MSRSPAGGIPARRAVVRWALRLLRREWRQQTLVLALLTVAATVSIGVASIAHNTVGVSGDGRFGSAQYRYTVDAPPRGTMPAMVAAAQERFGPVDVLARWTRAVPGSVESLEFRSQDPEGVFSTPMLSLRDGDYPRHEDELAITDGVVDVFGLGIGDTFDLDGRQRAVVGVVENPSDLNDEFALAAPADRERAELVTFLVDATTRGESPAFDRLGADFLGGRGEGFFQEVDSRDTIEESTFVAVAILGVTSIALVLVSLVATAGFTVLSQRRQRQLGMLAAIGATDTHLRFVVVANGAAIGVLAAVAGAVAGITAWTLAATGLEPRLGHRVDVWNLPWGTIAVAMALVVVAATAAAWWPARAAARMSVTSALSGRPPRPHPLHHSAALAGVLVGAGLICLAAADRKSPVLTVSGTVLTVTGVLLISPLALRAAARAGSNLPLAVRLSLRDLARHQARAGAALAAISLTLAIPAAIVITSTAAEHMRPPGNLSPSQLVMWTRDPAQPDGVSPYYTEDPNDSGFSPYLPRLADTELDAMAASVDGVAADLGEATVTSLRLVTDPALETTPDGRLAISLAQAGDDGAFDVAPVFMATAPLLDHYGVSLGDVDRGAAVLTVPPTEGLPSEFRRMITSDELLFSNTSQRLEAVGPVQDLEQSYTSLPGSFITPEAVRQRGWQPVRVGWLVEAASPVTEEQVRDVRQRAADAGMLVESRRSEPDVTDLRWAATAVGMLVALGVLAMTVGLVRTEAAGELRTLTATGATRGVRRSLSAATTGSLALLGALLGTTGAYGALIAGYLDDAGELVPVPIVNLLAIVLGIPTVAALSGWVLAGREPTVLARQVIE